MVHRHGSRYPEVSGDAAERTLGKKLTDAAGKFTGHGALEFLNYWTFGLGAEILVPMGKQELFNSGTLHYYQYGHLYPNNGSKIVVRSTTQRRMYESAEYFMAGFFGLGWAQNATLELAIESPGYNNTLAGYKQCNHSSWETARDGIPIPLNSHAASLTTTSPHGMGQCVSCRRSQAIYRQHHW
jgi:hypothetical protein